MTGISRKTMIPRSVQLLLLVLLPSLVLAETAEQRQVMGTVLASSVKLAACGLALGLAIAFPIALIVASRQPGFSPWSVPALGLSSAIVMVAAIAAAVQPARRVLRIQPGDIVRAE
jgi:ABC-type antimicrobial peptide transport system permease subunit